VRRRAAAFGAVVLALHVVGFGTLLLVVPELQAGPAAFGIGIGITAYVLGLRHGFDADHIAAIDNTTRALIGNGQRPLGVGFFFSLGHSSVVFVLVLLLVLGTRGLGPQLQDDGSWLQTAAGAIGRTVSGSFLTAIGILNLLILISALRVFRQVRRGDVAAADVRARLDARGVTSRVFARLTRRVRRSWQMYPIGLLFGLGFDTATEVALLYLAAGAGFGGVPFYAILCLPILFAAGMSLVDTLDGAFMNLAYGWALERPVRRIYFNIAITGLSVAVGLGVGAVQFLSLAGVATIDLARVGYLVVVLFVLTFAGAAAIWRVGRIEERWAGADQG
jgi:high-affinity nickel-transport protein